MLTNSSLNKIIFEIITHLFIGFVLFAIYFLANGDNKLNAFNRATKAIHQYHQLQKTLQTAKQLIESNKYSSDFTQKTPVNDLQTLITTIKHSSLKLERVSPQAASDHQFLLAGSYLDFLNLLYVIQKLPAAFSINALDIEKSSPSNVKIIIGFSHG